MRKILAQQTEHCYPPSSKNSKSPSLLAELQKFVLVSPWEGIHCSEKSFLTVPDLKMEKSNCLLLLILSFGYLFHSANSVFMEKLADRKICADKHCSCKCKVLCNEVKMCLIWRFAFVKTICIWWNTVRPGIFLFRCHLGSPSSWGLHCFWLSIHQPEERPDDICLFQTKANRWCWSLLVWECEYIQTVTSQLSFPIHFSSRYHAPLNDLFWYVHTWSFFSER